MSQEEVLCAVTWPWSIQSLSVCICLSSFLLYLIFYFIEVELLYNAVFISSIQQSNSVMHIHLSILFFSHIGYSSCLSSFWVWLAGGLYSTPFANKSDPFIGLWSENGFPSLSKNSDAITLAVKMIKHVSLFPKPSSWSFRVQPTHAHCNEVSGFSPWASDLPSLRNQIEVLWLLSPLFPPVFISKWIRYPWKQLKINTQNRSFISLWTMQPKYRPC